MLKRTCLGAIATLSFAAANARTDAVIEWNEIMTRVVAEQPPPYMNRFAAITQLAVFQAVDSMEEKAGRQKASTESAAIAAAHQALRHHFPERAPDLDTARVKSLARIPDGHAKRDGIAAGEAAAVAVINSRIDDGVEPPEFHLPDSANPGEWQVTPDCPPPGGLFVQFRNLKPFALRRGDQFRSEPPPRLDSAAYRRAHEEVKEVGARDSASRPPDRANVARLYAATGDALLWNTLARQLATARHRTPVENARMFALLNMALNDAGIAVLDTKYHYAFWRPETAIASRNPEAAFMPFITAPCFPSYPSGHASTSYAAQEILERTFGRRGHRLTVSAPSVPDVVLTYSTIRDITSDIDDARVYGGIHFRFDQTVGAEQGRAVGAYVFEHALRPPCDCER